MVLLFLAGGCSLEPSPVLLSRPLTDLRRAQQQAMARQNYGLAMELAEGLKCNELRHRLLNVRATPRKLQISTRIPRPQPEQGAGILAFYQDENQLYRFIAGQQGVSALPPLRLADLEPLIIAARDELEHGDLDPQHLHQLLSSLYIMLFSPAQALLKNVQNLLIIPHGLTRYLPFHALNRGSAQAPHFLVQDYTISYAPCLALAGPRPSPIYWVEIIAPLYGHQQITLPGARGEALLIAQKYGVNARLVHLGASARQFETALLRPLSLVHFSGHGLAELTPESPPELLFPHGQRSVTLESASREPARAEVVVLGSCASAYAARFRGEHPHPHRTSPRTPPRTEVNLAEVNLAEALLASGVNVVVAASWAVKDQQSARMMDTFYSSLKRQGVTPALNQAYRQAISQLRPPHPRFWAFYAVYGGWNTAHP